MFFSSFPATYLDVAQCCSFPHFICFPSLDLDVHHTFSVSGFLACSSCITIKHDGTINQLYMGYHLVMTNIAMENPDNKWRFLAGKIIYFYGPSIPCLCNKFPGGITIKFHTCQNVVFWRTQKKGTINPIYRDIYIYICNHHGIYHQLFLYMGYPQFFVVP